MIKTGELAENEIVSRRKERRVVVIASAFGFLMFLGLLACFAECGTYLPRLQQSLGIDAADRAGRRLFRHFERILRLQPLLLRQLPAADHGTLAGADAAARRHRRLPSPARPQDPLLQARRRPARRPRSNDQGPAVAQRRAGAGRACAGAGKRAGRQDGLRTYIEKLPGGASYSILKADGGNGFSDNTQEFVVPAGNLFMLGDNRDNSTDSRHQSPTYGVGFVPVELVIGRVILTF